MIVDNLQNFNRYINIHPHFKKAFKFLTKNSLNFEEDKQYQIDKDNVFAVVAIGKGKSKTKSKLEAHRKYIDIQLLIKGNEQIGWKDLHQCSKPVGRYNNKKDIIFFKDKPDLFIPLKPLMFCIFFPEDAHMPMIGQSKLTKVIIKIKK